MKKTIGILVLAVLVSFTSAQAASISFASGDGGDVLVSSVVPGAITVIAPHSAWGDVSDNAGIMADWISYTNTGVGAIVAPNVSSRTAGDETMHVQRQLSIGETGSLALWVLADDTAQLDITGPGGFSFTELAFLGQVDPCAPGGTGVPIGCAQADMGVYNFTNLAAGLYTLTFRTFQTNADVSGLQYAGLYDSVDVTPTLTAVP